MGKINKDIDQWSMKFSLFYYGINFEQDIKSDEVLKIITEEVIERDFDSQLKVPTRLVLEMIFKTSYKMGKNCLNTIQSSAILRVTLYILLSMLINIVFDKTKVSEYFLYFFQDPKNQGVTQIDFINFNLWIAQSSKETLLDQTHHLIKIIFGEKTLQILVNKV